MQNKHQTDNKLAMTKHVGKNNLAPSRTYNRTCQACMRQLRCSY